MSNPVEIHMLFTQKIDNVLVPSGKIFKTSEKIAQDLIDKGFAEPARRNILFKKPSVFSSDQEAEDGLSDGVKDKKNLKKDRS